MSADETNGTRMPAQYEYTVNSIDCEWSDLEGHLEQVIHDHLVAGFELVFVNGPVFARGTFMVLTFRKEKS